MCEATVPGCVHVDLFRAGKIGDPFWADNEVRDAWVHNADWTYSREFRCDPRLLDSDRVYLECDGLDTIAEVYINGTLLGKADNMYVQHRFDVTGKLKPGSNAIEVRFSSPVTFTQPFVDKDPLISPSHSIPGAIYTRKSPSQWGWDWGPQIPTIGIWKPVRLVSYDTARIEDLRIRQRHECGAVTLQVETALELLERRDCRVDVRLIHPGGRVEEHGTKMDDGSASCSIGLTEPDLWWPNGYGKQPLYRVEAVLTCGGEELHVFSRQIGLRTLELRREKDKFGTSFMFVVNGVPIFCKGANWIPADQFPGRLTHERYRHLISSAAKANMNMLRVWGGGYYEHEWFYDLCDEHGILIWQDFMFSCSQYPVDQDCLCCARQDIEANIMRLRNRACLALWCGNNEMEWFLADGWGGERNAEFKRNHTLIFHEMIAECAARLDPDRSYWPSSPSCGEEPFDAPNAEDRGDGHYWDVWHNRQPFTAYRSHYFRFMSEFGFESMPSIETVKSFANPEDHNMTSYVMECHQKNGGGNGLILYYLAQTFRFPEDFEKMCYVSQLLQAEAMRYGVEHWRRNRNDNRCMGTLYWQINDCWPVASWSSIDYFGRWKALHYAARRFYKPVLLSVCEEGTQAAIHITNDTLKPVQAEVRWSLERMDGTAVREGVITVQAAPEYDTLVAQLDFVAELAGDARRHLVLVTELVADGAEAGRAVTSFVPSKHLELPAAEIKLIVGHDQAGSFLEASTDHLARYACLSVPGQDVIFSDNYFDLPAGRKAIVRVESEIDPAGLAKATAYSLRDSY